MDIIACFEKIDKTGREFALLTFLLKNGYVSMILGWVLYAAGMILFAFFSEGFGTEMDVMVFESGISAVFALKTVLWSVAVGEMHC